MIYYILTKEQAEVLNSTQVGIERGFARKTLGGEWVTAESSIHSFPELFNWSQLPKKELSITDFEVFEEDFF